MGWADLVMLWRIRRLRYLHLCWRHRTLYVFACRTCQRIRYQ